MAFFAKTVAIVNFHVFFGRHCEKDDITVKVLHDVGIFKGHGYSKKIADLYVVTTAVSRARYRISVRVIPADNGVEFTQKRNSFARLFPFDTSLHTRDFDTHTPDLWLPGAPTHPMTYIDGMMNLLGRKTRQ